MRSNNGKRYKEEIKEARIAGNPTLGDGQGSELNSGVVKISFCCHGNVRNESSKSSR
ncbi:hypothetical protein AA0X71_18505 [Robertmurraya sp. 2P01SA]|uniref:hypothetical protein n=1 Tax=Robertmurraya sp. 2P01SA TaxID=3132300 RepID=UPI0039A5881E